MPTVARLVGVGAVMAALAIVGSPSEPSSAGGFVFTPTRFDDPIPIIIPVCLDDNCSLREAIRAANAQSGHDTIIIPPGTYTLSQDGEDWLDDVALVGDLDITDDVTIQGAGAASTIIDGGGIGTFVFGVGIPPALCCALSAHIEGVTVRNAGTAGIFNRQVLTIADSVVRDNTYNGIVNWFGELDVSNTTVAGNAFFPAGAGIANTGTLTLTESTVSDNQAFGVDGAGGGIWNRAPATATITNSTISGNTSTDEGGGVWNDGKLDLTNVTITDNQAEFGGGIFNAGSAGDLTLTNTIVAGNSATISAPDCSGSLNSSGRDIIQNLEGCVVTGVLNLALLGLDPLLGPLGHYSGATDTHVLRSHSPAIDAGSAGACPAIDQRGVARPLDGDDDGLSDCDIGAFELQPVCGGDGAVLSPSDIAIPDDDPGGINSTVGLLAPGLEIIDLNLCLAIPHSWVGDLAVTLTHLDTGTSAMVIDRPGKTNGGFGCSGDDIFVLLDDEAGPAVENQCAPQLPSISGNFAPNDPLSVFDGEDISGDWRLTVSDNAGGDIGVLDRWDLLPQLAPVTPTPTLIDGGTPTPASITPSPSPTASATATATGSPTVTASPKPSDSATPTVTATPTPPGSPSGNDRIWGDNNCSTQVDPVDSLFVLRFDAGLPTDTGACSDMGQVIDVQNASLHSWGDVDCSGEVTPVDSLKILRYDAGLSVSQEADCPPIGAEVNVQ